MTKRKKTGWRAHFSDEPLPEAVVQSVAEQEPIVVPRRLAYTHGAPERHSGVMILLDENDEPVMRYRCERMFNRVQRYGQWYRLQGQDRATGECIYTPELQEATP